MQASSYPSNASYNSRVHSPHFTSASHLKSDQTSLLNAKLVDAYHQNDLFKVSDLLHEGADPCQPIPLTEHLLLSWHLSQHPDSFIEDICDEPSFFGLRNLENYPEVQNMMAEIRELKEEGHEIPSSIVKDCLVKGMEISLGVSVGSEVTPLWLAVANEDVFMTKQLLDLGADITVCRTPELMKNLEITTDLWYDEIDLRQLLIDHGLMLTEFLPSGKTLKDFIFDVATDTWGGQLKTLKFIARNTPNFEQLLNEKDEDGLSLYARIVISDYCHEFLQFLTQEGGRLNLLRNLEEIEEEPIEIEPIEVKILDSEYQRV